MQKAKAENFGFFGFTKDTLEEPVCHQSKIRRVPDEPLQVHTNTTIFQKAVYWYYFFKRYLKQRLPLKARGVCVIKS